MTKIDCEFQPNKNAPNWRDIINSHVLNWSCSTNIDNRLKLYTPESKEALFLKKEIEATKTRFERYGESGLLCGKEGLPRIITTGQWDRANEFVIPGILFLYIFTIPDFNVRMPCSLAK